MTGEDTHRLAEELVNLAKALGQSLDPEEGPAGGEECQWCPWCRLLRMMRSTNPEIGLHLAAATTSLLQAATLAIGEPVRRSPGEASVEHIDLDDAAHQEWPDDDTDDWPDHWPDEPPGGPVPTHE